MGLYQQYIKNNVPPLRDPDPEAKPAPKATFGNPWKVSKIKLYYNVALD